MTDERTINPVAPEIEPAPKRARKAKTHRVMLLKGYSPWPNDDGPGNGPGGLPAKPEWMGPEYPHGKCEAGTVIAVGPNEAKFLKEANIGDVQIDF